MEKFTKLEAIAAPLPMINVDTDVIIPKQFLRTIKRTGLGIHAFNDLRYLDDGSENPDFVLNQEPYKNARILITGENFGCGSSREHAPWALLDFGLKCVISESFADIFYNNCFKNGILPIVLEKKNVEDLTKTHQKNPDQKLEVDLEKQIVKDCNKIEYKFQIDPFRKHCLLNGLDDIALTLEKSEAIAEFENKDSEKRSWL